MPPTLLHPQGEAAANPEMDERAKGSTSALGFEAMAAQRLPREAIRIRVRGHGPPRRKQAPGFAVLTNCCNCEPYARNGKLQHPGYEPYARNGTLQHPAVKPKRLICEPCAQNGWLQYLGYEPCAQNGKLQCPGYESCESLSWTMVFWVMDFHMLAAHRKHLQTTCFYHVLIAFLANRVGGYFPRLGPEP